MNKGDFRAGARLLIRDRHNHLREISVVEVSSHAVKVEHLSGALEWVEFDDGWPGYGTKHWAFVENLPVEGPR